MAEQEEGVHWIRTENVCTVHSWRDAVYKVLTEAGFEPTRTHVLDGEVVGWTWHNIPKELIRVQANGMIALKGTKQQRRQQRIEAGVGKPPAPFPYGANFTKRTRSSGKQGHSNSET